MYSAAYFTMHNTPFRATKKDIVLKFISLVREDTFVATIFHLTKSFVVSSLLFKKIVLIFFYYLIPLYKYNSFL